MERLLGTSVGRQEAQPTRRRALSDDQRRFGSRYKSIAWTVKIAEAGGRGVLCTPIVLSMIHDRYRPTGRHHFLPPSCRTVGLPKEKKWFA